MHRIIFKCPRRSVSELFSGSLLPQRGKINGPVLVESFQTIAGSQDAVTFFSGGDPITSPLGLRVVNALQLGFRSQASDMISEVGAVSHERNVEDIAYILEYCARSPDPLFVMETWRVLEGKNIALSWKCYMLIARALSKGGYLEEALHLVQFVGENNRISFMLPLYNSFLSACANVKNVELFNHCLDLMERQSLGKNEATYSALLELAVWQKNLSAVHEIWREHGKNYNMNIISLRKFIWSFACLKDLKSAYGILQHMVDLAVNEDVYLCRTKEGKLYCPQLDIPIPKCSLTSIVGQDLHKDQHASSDGEGILMNGSEGLQCSPFYAKDNTRRSTGIKLLDDNNKEPIKTILRWSFNDVIRACGYRKKAKLAQFLILQMQSLGLEATSKSYNGLAKATIRCKDFGNTVKLLKVMQSKNLKPYDSTLSTLSACCSKALHLDLAEVLLNQTAASRSTFPYNAFFRACDLLDQPERALKMLAKMRKVKSKPNIRTYELLFSLFGNVNAPYEKGDSLSHAYVAKRISAIETDMLENGIYHSQRSMLNLLKVLGSEGMIQDLLKYLRRAEIQFSVNSRVRIEIYNSVMHSLVKANESHMAFEIFKNIKLCGFQPNAATYTIMIDCCSNIRCFKSACALVSMMVRDGFPLHRVTYTALLKILLEYDAFNDALDLVDLAILEGCKLDVEVFNTILVRAYLQGRIDIVETLVQAMHQKKIKPNSFTCNMVLNAYVDRKYLGTAVEALQVLSLRMISLNPQTLNKMEMKYGHLILAEGKKAGKKAVKKAGKKAVTQIMELFRGSPNLATALLNLRWCSIMGSTISWLPKKSPWAIRLGRTNKVTREDGTKKRKKREKKKFVKNKKKQMQRRVKIGRGKKKKTQNKTQKNQTLNC